MNEFESILERVIACFEKGLAKENPEASPSSRAFTAGLVEAFEAQGGFLEKLKQLDLVFDAHPVYKPMQELCFDLLMIRFLSIDSPRLQEGYLDSPEWEKIEQKILDRGTEALNILLYFTEAKEAEVTPSLDDFLNEFLLVDDDLYQDEYDIYEPFISNQEMAEDAEAEELVAVAKKIKDDDMQLIFLPLMLFFNKEIPEEEKKDILFSNSPQPAEHLALYEAIRSFA